MNAFKFGLLAEIDADGRSGLANGFANARGANAGFRPLDLEEIDIEDEVSRLEKSLAAGEQSLRRFLALGDLGVLERRRPAVLRRFAVTA